MGTKIEEEETSHIHSDPFKRRFSKLLRAPKELPIRRRKRRIDDRQRILVSSKDWEESNFTFPSCRISSRFSFVMAQRILSLHPARSRWRRKICHKKFHDDLNFAWERFERSSTKQENFDIFSELCDETNFHNFHFLFLPPTESQVCTASGVCRSGDTESTGGLQGHVTHR